MWLHRPKERLAASNRLRERVGPIGFDRSRGKDSHAGSLQKLKGTAHLRIGQITVSG